MRVLLFTIIAVVPIAAILTSCSEVSEPESPPELTIQDGSEPHDRASSGVIKYGDIAVQRKRNKRAFEMIDRRPHPRLSDVTDEQLCSFFRSEVGKPLNYPPADDPNRPILFDFAQELLRRQVLRLGLTRKELEATLGTDTKGKKDWRTTVSNVSDLVIYFDEADLVKGLAHAQEGEAATGSFYISPDGNLW